MKPHVRSNTRDEALLFSGNVVKMGEPLKNVRTSLGDPTEQLCHLVVSRRFSLNQHTVCREEIVRSDPLGASHITMLRIKGGFSSHFGEIVR